MPHIHDAHSSYVRPVLRGRRGAVSAAHPLAVAAGQEMLNAGGSAIDAAIAAQAVLTVVEPDACSLGGDMLCLVGQADGEVVALNGAGAGPIGYAGEALEGGNSITTPGIVDAWREASSRWGRLPLERALRPAIDIAESGFRVSEGFVATRDAHSGRLRQGGAASWSIFALRPGDVFVQPALATLLKAIGRDGASAFYQGEMAAAIARAVAATGGKLSERDLAAHQTGVAAPVVTGFAGVRVATQPPMAQGVLLNMALAGLERCGALDPEAADHVGVELTEASFAFRARVGEGAALLKEELKVDRERASRRGGPRAYLHTAGVAASDADGMTVSSLVSVFDFFGSCVFVPEGGFTLNDRAAGFGPPPNDPAPGKRPVHTLAPCLVMDGEDAFALATPGADGQIQTLLQILSKTWAQGRDLAAAVAAPRWRSENGDVLIERSHPSLAALGARGHGLRVLEDGDLRFGGVVLAGRAGGDPIAGADWRRRTWCGVV